MADGFAAVADIFKKCVVKTETDIGRKLDENELKLMAGFMFLRILETSNKKGKKIK